jgi:SAM-dependent methyltransferase
MSKLMGVFRPNFGKSEMFDHLTAIYDAMIDWPKRLAAEEPFYRRWFQEVGAKRVLDAACGTGRHAAMFNQWGLEVEGADISPAMIEQARKTFGEPPGRRLAVRGFDQPVYAPSAWDAVVCVGNSLSLAPERETVFRAIRQMMAALRPGGVLLVQVLNLWRLTDGPCLWQKCLRTQLPQGDVLILKGVHRSGDRGFVELVVFGPDGGPLVAQESPQFLGLETSELEAAARAAGAADVQFFGGYAGQPYDRAASVDLVMVALAR